MVHKQTGQYAVIFINKKSANDDGYAEAAEQMEQLARAQPGFIDFISITDGDATITLSYWQDEAAIAAWRDNIEHQAAQQSGKTRWYDEYALQVCRIERAYGFTKSPRR